MNRLRELREALGISMREAASRLNMPYTTYVNYEKGTREPNSETLIQLADFFNTSIDFLLGNPNIRGEYTLSSNIMPMPEMRKIPRIGRIACGEPITAEENIEEYDESPISWHADFSLLCVGDSMAPKIEDGDIVAIRCQHEVHNGEIAAVRIGDEATLKMVFLHHDYIELRPVNPAYPSIIRRLEQMDEIRIEGKAVGLFRNI